MFWYIPEFLEATSGKQIGSQCYGYADWFAMQAGLLWMLSGYGCCLTMDTHLLSVMGLATG